MVRFLASVILLFPMLVGAAESAGILRLTSSLPLAEAYSKVYASLEDEKFWVVFEADMGSRMAKFADKWGDEYNRRGLGAVKGMVFCNIWWTNRVANADPDLLALCPLHLSLYERDGETVLVMPRLSMIAQGSEGRDRALELEQELTAILRAALAAEK